MSRDSLEQRFWNKVDTSGECWLWTGARYSNGYGRMRCAPEFSYQNAHRVSWFLQHGSWPPRRLYVCHSCDNKLCVRPEHLFLGTSQDNMLDASNKNLKIGRPRQTACKRGHEMSEQNTYVQIIKGRRSPLRRCRICMSLRRRGLINA